MGDKTKRIEALEQAVKILQERAETRTVRSLGMNPIMAAPYGQPEVSVELTEGHFNEEAERHVTNCELAWSRINEDLEEFMDDGLYCEAMARATIEAMLNAGYTLQVKDK